MNEEYNELKITQKGLDYNDKCFNKKYTRMYNCDFTYGSNLYLYMKYMRSRIYSMTSFLVNEKHI